ncbi:MAG: ABC transporter permease subunit [Anaerolineae bacterium]|nr:ABC transporter permease subunit [Anaerolineae bacterium]
MTSVITIAGRELKAYLFSPLAWIILGLFAFFTGFIFVQIMVASRVADMAPLFNWIAVLSLILAPALTMRLFSEEYKLGTMEMLLTAPARDWQIVVGKFIAAWVGFAVLLIPTLWQVLILERYGDPDYGILGASYLGALLLGAAFVGIGMFASSLTQNQFIAYMIGMIALLFLWVADAPANAIGQNNPIADFFRYLALPGQFQEFFNGVIASQHVLFFVSIALITIVLTTLVVSSRRWR